MVQDLDHHHLSPELKNLKSTNMKKILIAIFILCSVQSFGQATFRIKDSTLRFMTGTLTSKVPQFVRPMYGQELSRNNSSTLKMLVLDTARAALGLKAWYWQDIPSGGGGGSADTVNSGAAKKAAYYPTAGRTIDDVTAVEFNNTDNSMIVTAQTSTDVPLRIKMNGGQYSGANPFEVVNSSGTILAFLNSAMQFKTAQNIVAFNGATEQVLIGYSSIGAAAGIDFGISSDASIYRSTANELTAYVQRFKYTGRAQLKQGADVTSANNLTLGTDGNVFEITGTTQVNLIANTNWQNGSEITLLLASGITIKHGQATSGSNITISLSGAADLVTAAETTLTLVLSEVGGTQKWREKGRVSY